MNEEMRNTECGLINGIPKWAEELAQRFETMAELIDGPRGTESHGYSLCKSMDAEHLRDAARAALTPRGVVV